MIKSQLLQDIFDIAFDSLENEDNLRQQIQFLNESDREHTGVGLYINFTIESGIENYKGSNAKSENKKIEGKKTEIINGVELRNEKLNILADIIIHLKDGFIECVEIWNKNGEEYPNLEPTEYELQQVWLESNKRSIIRN